jgi:hypothetical protein
MSILAAPDRCGNGENYPLHTVHYVWYVRFCLFKLSQQPDSDKKPATTCTERRADNRDPSREAPALEEALEKAAGQELPYIILDGTLISSDRCTDKKTSKKGMEIDKWHSGKAHEHAGLVHGIMNPDGIPRWVSDILPGSTHDITSARKLVLPALRPWLAQFPASPIPATKAAARESCTR